MNVKNNRQAYINRSRCAKGNTRPKKKKKLLKIFIPASNEPKPCLHGLGDCREGQIPRSLLRCKFAAPLLVAGFLTLIVILAVLIPSFLNEKIISNRLITDDLSSSHNVSMKDLHSSNAILLDVKSGRMIAGKNPDRRIYPASMTKIMTALIAIQSIPDLNEQITVPDDFYPYLKRMDASMAGFEPGETACAEDFIYGILLPSGAECCLTLAEYISGSESAFVDLMNHKAGELGMKNTHFKNTTGLQDKAHYTTVRDISVLLQYALKNPEFRKVFESKSYTIEATNMHPDGFTIQSTLFKEMQNAGIQGKEISGGKTGYTDEAGLCLASLADVKGRAYILVSAKAKGSPKTPPYHIKDAVSIYRQLEDG